MVLHHRNIKTRFKYIKFYLDKANLLSVTAEALSAAHQSILPDYPMRIPAYAAGETQIPPNNHSIKRNNSKYKLCTINNYF